MRTHLDLFTYALVWENGEVEEVDVWARSENEALKMVQEEAPKEYLPGYKIEPLPPGGSGGFYIGYVSE